MVCVVGVRFKKAGKVYYFDPGEFALTTGMKVVVETARGIEYGEVAVGPKEVPEDQVVQPLKKVIRPGTERDALIAAENKRKEKEAFAIALKKIEAHGLPMNLVDVEYTFDSSKIIFYFTADGRVDFRELVRDLAGVFRSRIELRQIGVRDEAKLLGGIGPCGRILCCTSFLGDFAPVSIRMAKDQNLSLNPSKISGLCGRLMCCLRFEQETYEAAKKDPTLAPGYVPPVILEETVPELEELEETPGPRIGVAAVGESGVSARIARAAGLVEDSPWTDRSRQVRSQREERRSDRPASETEVAHPGLSQPQETGPRKDAKEKGKHVSGGDKQGSQSKPQQPQQKAKPEEKRPQQPSHKQAKSGHPQGKHGQSQKAGQQPDRPLTTAHASAAAPAGEAQSERQKEGGRERRRHQVRRHRRKTGGKGEVHPQGGDRQAP